MQRNEKPKTRELWKKHTALQNKAYSFIKRKDVVCDLSEAFTR